MALPDLLADLLPEAFESPDMSAHRRRLHRNRNAPAVIERVLVALAVNGSDRVLQVGVGTGYVTAVLARVAREVVAIERKPHRAAHARAKLKALGLNNVTIVEADGARGWIEQAPYDVILVSARQSRRPRQLARQLVRGGRMVAFVGHYRARQTLVRMVRTTTGDLFEEVIGEVQFFSRLDEILVEIGALEPAAGEAALHAALTRAVPIEQVLRDDYQLAERDIVRAIALQRGLEIGDAAALIESVDLDVRAGAAEPFLRRNRLVPIHLRQGVLTVAAADADADFEALAKAYDARSLSIHLVTPTDLERIRGAEPDAVLDLDLATDEGNDLLDDTEHMGRFVDVFRRLLLMAVGEGASDLHLERYGNTVRVRLRIDGALVENDQVPLSPADLIGVLNVIKVQAGLDIADRHHPQGGRFETQAGTESFDLRVQTQPALHGEHVIIRLLSHRGAQRSIDGLGFDAGLSEGYRRLLRSPQGLVLVVGPTGSGKTTTLYAGLQVLAADAERKVITVEDPIEYSLDGIQQTAVRPRFGFDFADAMRVFVRQDPDCIFVGEIRDPETALEAIRASQTGHLVLSTLHCNDAPDAVQRLVDLGMHPNSIAAELLAVLAQRLARRICNNCKVEARVPAALLAEVFPSGVPEGFTAYAGEGCPRCGGRGVSGRIAVGELLLPSVDFKRAIAERAPLHHLRAVAVKDGMTSLRRAALDLVTAGVIPLTELVRMLPPDRIGAGG